MVKYGVSWAIAIYRSNLLGTPTSAKWLTSHIGFVEAYKGQKSVKFTDKNVKPYFVI